MKVRSFVLNDTITSRRIKQLMRQIELCKANNINLYICSHGGEGWMANIFVDFTHRTKKKIHFIGSGNMQSAGINIFIESKGKKSISPYTCAMLHLVTYTPESRDLLNKKSYDSLLMKEIAKENSDKVDLYVKYFNLSNQEKDVLNNGGDLGIDYNRLKKSIPKLNKQNK